MLSLNLTDCGQVIKATDTVGFVRRHHRKIQEKGTGEGGLHRNERSGGGSHDGEVRMAPQTCQKWQTGPLSDQWGR